MPKLKLRLALVLLHRDPEAGEAKEGEADIDEEALKEEEEAKELTLDEYKQQLSKERAQTQFKIRRPGEGEDTSQWGAMHALKKQEKKVEEEKVGTAAKVKVSSW